MTRRSLLTLCALTAVAAFTGPVRAHVSLEVPKARYWSTTAMQADQAKQKTGPCGASRDARTTNASLITTYKPGEKVMVKWSETIQHPGHFVISFDSDGQDFPTPGSAPAADSGVTVLVANIADKSSAAYTQEVTLPNMECSKCTLQLVQVMTTAPPPYGSADLYFNCADIVIKADGAGGGAGGSGGSGTAGSGTSGGVGGSSGGSLGTSGAGVGGINSNGGAAGSPSASGGSPGASGASSGGMPGQGTGVGGMMSTVAGTTGMSTSGGASASGGAPPTSGGTLNTSGGAPGASGGAPTGASGAAPQPPSAAIPEEPGCSLVATERSPGFAGLAAAALVLAAFAHRRRRHVR